MSFVRNADPSSSRTASLASWSQAPPAIAAADPRQRFAELHTRHFDFVWRSLRHLGVSEPAMDDAVQEVWLTVHRKLESFEGRSAATTWLFGIAFNVARAQGRARRRANAVEPLSEEIASESLDPERILVGQDAWSQVQSFLDTLPEQHRAIFVCALLENLAPAETAEALGVEVDVVYRRVRALRRGFVRFLERGREKMP